VELHLATGFTKFFIEPNFICRGDIRTYHDMLMEDAELLNTVHSKNTSFLWTNAAFHSDQQ